MKTLRLLSLIVIFSLCAFAADKNAEFSSLPAAAQASISAALGADESAYFATTNGHGVFKAENRGQKLDFTFAPSGMEVQRGLAQL